MPALVETQQVGKREDLRDILTIAEATDFPLLAMCKKYPGATNTLVSWGVDAYDPPNLAGIVDGADVKSYENPQKYRATLQNYVQWVRRTVMVGKLANESDVAGVGKAKEMAHGISKKMTELRRDIEAILGSDNDAQLQQSESQPYMTRGLGSWFSSSAQTTLPVPTSYLTPSGSINATATGSLTEANFKDVLQSIYLQLASSATLDMICGAALKRAISGFTQTQAASTNVALAIKSYTQPMESNKIIASIKIYEGDFNVVNLIPSPRLGYGSSTTQNIRNARGYIVDFSRFGIAFRQDPQVEPLSDSGGGPRAMVDAVFSTIHENPLIGAKFNATS
jgi:hypothetical protein